ncbi:MAG: DinB family protein [Burkholderiales bacterium]|nr:DinB family protein [Burkholderiales bacterium]
MISVEYCQLLARYNRWMNERLYACAGELADDARKRDRGAFFGSIHRTLNHILWGDRVWLGRFTGSPCTVAAYGADMFEDLAALLAAREATDTAILDWAGALPRDWLASAVEYRAAADGRLRRLPAWVAATHLFQHATHHRGQVTALLKQEGKDIGATDLPWLPGVVRRTD